MRPPVDAWGDGGMGLSRLGGGVNFAVGWNGVWFFLHTWRDAADKFSNGDLLSNDWKCIAGVKNRRSPGGARARCLEAIGRSG